MEIIVNGIRENVEEKTTIYLLVKNKKFDSSKIVVEHNLEIISEHNWENVLLVEMDRIEIVSFVGGG